MVYNVFISTQVNEYALPALKREAVDKIIQAHHHGDSPIMVSGRKIFMRDLFQIQIFDNSKLEDPYNIQSVKEYILKLNRFGNEGEMDSDFFLTLGSDVTDEFEIGKEGYQSEFPLFPDIAQSKSVYIDKKRKSELEKIINTQFDLSKLIRLCDELDSAYSNKNFISVGLLIRAIIDHIPPIFDFGTFKDFANQYQSAGASSSFKKSMLNLDNSMRNIVDRLVHSTITKSETLPNETQVDCKRELDVLLGEIVRVLKLTT